MSARVRAGVLLLLTLQEWQVQQLCYEVDVEPYARSRDADIQQLAAAAGVQVSAHVSHTMYDPDALIRAAGGKVPLTMQAFTKLVDRVGDPPPAVAAPDSVPPPAAAVLAQGERLDMPTLAEAGFTDQPTTIFKVRVLCACVVVLLGAVGC